MFAKGKCEKLDGCVKEDLLGVPVKDNNIVMGIVAAVEEKDDMWEVTIESPDFDKLYTIL